MEVGKIWLDALVVGDRHRMVDVTKVDSLAESMKELGLQQPISVWFDDDDAMHLIAGLHRVRAAEKLGWEQIDAITVSLDPIGREMWEISENLHRSGLTKEERDEHIRRYAELLVKRREVALEATGTASRHDVARLGQGVKGGTGVAKQVAADTGLSQRTVQRVLADPKPPVSRPVVEVMSDDEIAHQQYEALCRLWNKSSPKARELFMDFVS